MPEGTGTDGAGTALIDGEGNFTEHFTTKLPGFLGRETLTHEDGSPIKMFDDIKSVGGLVKVAFDTKTALGKKLDSVIQKPAADASDQVKGDYYATLAKELGAPDSPDAYEFVRPTNGDGVEYDQAAEDLIRAAAFKAKVPVSTVKAFSEILLEAAKARAKADHSAAEKLFEEDAAAFDEDFAGDKKPEALRTAFLAIEKFGDKELVKALKDAAMHDQENIVDLAKWRQNGVSIPTLRLFTRIGQAALSTTPGGGGGGLGEEGSSIKDMYPNSPELWPENQK